MKKRIISLILLAGVLLAAIPVCAEVSVFGEDYSKKIDISGFRYILKDPLGAPVNELIPEGTVSVSFKAKKSQNGTGSQPCMLVVTVYNGGKLYGTKIASAVVPEDGSEVTVKLAEPIALPADVSDLRIYSYVWTDLLNPRILARPATFASSSNALYELCVNGMPVDVDEAFKEGDTYYCELDKIPLSLPTVSAKADDLGAKVEISDITSLPGTAKVNITSQTGVKKEYNIEFSVKAKQRTVEGAIIADTNSRTSQYLTNYSPTGPWMQTNLYNGVPMTNSFNGTLKRALIQLDVKSFPDDTSLIKDIYLSVTGQCNYVANHLTAYCPAGITVNAYDYSEFSWSETSVDAAATTVGPGLTDIVKKTPFDSFFVEKTDSTSGPWVEHRVNVTKLVKEAKENGQEKITVILLADNSERNTAELAALKNQNSNNRDELMFVMGTKENPEPTRTPKVIIEEFEKEE